MHRTPRLSRSWFGGPGGRRFGCEFALVVVAKLAALALLWWFCFTPSTRPQLTTDGVAGHLLAPVAAEAGQHD